MSKADQYARKAARWTDEEYADAVLAEGLASEAEVRQTIAGLTALTEHPDSIIACPRIFQVRGRKP